MEAATRYTHDGSEPVRTSPYAQGVAKLREARQERPFTFRENVLARVEAYERGNKTLFSIYLDSCTGVAYKGKSTRFQIVSPSSELISIPANFNNSFLPINFDHVQGIELDSSNGKYNQGLPKDEVLDHLGWLIAMEADSHLLKTYCDIVFAELGNPKTAMAFYVRQNTKQDELRALFVNNLDIHSYAEGNSSLNDGESFLRGSPVVGASREKTGSAYRNPALTEQERLEQRIVDVLSPFDKHVGNFNQKQYQRDKQTAVNELLKLYKGR